MNALALLFSDQMGTEAASGGVEPARHIAGPHPHRPGYGLEGLDIGSLWGRTGGPPVLLVGLKDPNWLARPETRHPGMVSRNTLGHGRRRSPWPRARVPWALDSGAYTAWSRGGWDITAEQWAEEIRHHHEHIGSLLFAAGMDWLVTPEALAATGRSAEYHLQATVENHQELAALLDRTGDPHILPTVQGRTPDEYERCLHLFLDSGVDLCRSPLVGAGSLAGGRRHWGELLEKLAVLGEAGVTRIHAFGVHGTVKLSRLAHRCVSVDSMAWSRRGRALARRPECTHGGEQEQNCLTWSQQWADEQLADARNDTRAVETISRWVLEQHLADPHAASFDTDALRELEAVIAAGREPRCPAPERAPYRRQSTTTPAAPDVAGSQPTLPGIW